MTFDDYYLHQSGTGVYEGPLWQEGGAIKGYAGKQFQYGHGIGSFGRMLFRWAKPLLKYLGREGLKTGVNIGSDVLAGTDIKESVTNRMKESGNQIASDAVEVVKKKLRGRGRKKGKKVPKRMARRRRRGTRRTHKKPAIRRRKTVKRRRSRRTRVKKALKDIFS